MTASFDQLRESVPLLTDGELRDAWQVLRAEHDARQRRLTFAFAAGQLVWFNSRHGERLYGTVVRIGPKNVVVAVAPTKLTPALTWRCSPSLLHKVEARA